MKDLREREGDRGWPRWLCCCRWWCRWQKARPTECEGVRESEGGCPFLDRRTVGPAAGRTVVALQFERRGNRDKSEGRECLGNPMF